MCHWGGFHWFPRDELGNGIQRFALGVKCGSLMAQKNPPSAAGAGWHPWSPLSLPLLSQTSPRLQILAWSLWDFHGCQNSRGTSTGNISLLAKPLYSRARVKGGTRVTQSTNYVIKISCSALTVHSVVIYGEIIQLATELTFWTAFTGCPSDLYLVLNIF